MTTLLADDGVRLDYTQAGELHDHATRDWRPVIATADLPVPFVAGDSSEFWPASHTSACEEKSPVGTSIVIADDGHADNIEKPTAFNDALLGFLRAL